MPHHVAEAAVAITLRRSQTFVCLGGPSAEDDFDVMDDGNRIGRIYFQLSSSQPWRWCLSQALVNDKKGRTDTRALALHAFTEAYAHFQQRSDEPASVPRQSLRVMGILAGIK